MKDHAPRSSPYSRVAVLLLCATLLMLTYGWVTGSGGAGKGDDAAGVIASLLKSNQQLRAQLDSVPATAATLPAATVGGARCECDNDAKVSEGESCLGLNFRTGA